MAAICFDFYYRPKPSQIRQNGSAAAYDVYLAGFGLISKPTIYTSY